MIYSANAQSTVNVIKQLPPMPQGWTWPWRKALKRNCPRKRACFA
jgi:hypothetical protein